MTEVLSPRPAASEAPSSDPITDTELIALVRSGDSAAYEELFLRHRDVALRYARRLADSERAEDLCAEAFVKILDLLQRGKGPDVAFRAYLLTTVRTSHLNTLRASSREDLVPDHEPISRMLPVIEDPDLRFDRGAICRAFAQLPERWQVALWLTAVEGLNHDEVSEHLGIKSNAVASLAYRARSGLRQAYLAEHLLTITDPKCRAVVQQLPSYLRNQVTSRRRKLVDDHLETCAACTAAALELSEVDNKLGAVLPIALGGFTVGSAAIATQATGVLASVKGATSVLLGNAKAAGSALPGVLGTKAAAVATVTALGVAVGAEVIHLQDDVPGPQREVPSVAQTLAPQAPPSEKPIAPPPTPTVAAARLAPSPSAFTSLLPPAASNPSSTPTPLPSTPTTPAAPSPSPSVSAPPVTAPSFAPTPTPTAAQRTMALGSVTDQPSQEGPTRWEDVRVAVTDPAKGATLVVTTNRTVQVRPATTAGTGWVCGLPTSTWFNGTPYAKTKITCSYGNSGNGQPLRFTYQVAKSANLTAEVTPPYGYADTTLADNLKSVTLRN